jgi:AraC-like DNA-binding protein
MPAAERAREAWQRFDLRRIEDLENAVLGAEFEAIQMAGPLVRGSLAFATEGGIVWSSGRIEGNVLLRRTRPDDTVTLGILLVAGRGARLGMRPALDGTVGMSCPGGGQEAYLTGGTLYLAATMTRKRLERTAERAGLPAVPEVAGPHPVPLETGALEAVRRDAVAVHDGETSSGRSLGHAALGAILAHYAADPAGGRPLAALPEPARIVRAAHAYIERNLSAPILVGALAEAADTSPRTLYRAFSAVLGDTPQGYIRRLRLHCVRRRILAADDPARTVLAAARRTGLESDMGRLAVHYRMLFGESPSATLARRRAHMEAAGLM